MLNFLLGIYLIAMGIGLIILLFVGFYIVIRAIMEHKGSMMGDFSYVASRNRFNQGNINVMARDMKRQMDLSTLARNDRMTGRDK